MALFLATGCRKDAAPPRWDLHLTGPLANTTLTLGDLVPDSILGADSAGNLSILYTANLFSLSLDTVLTAPDTSFRYAYALPFPGPFDFQPGATFTTSDDVTEFELDGLQLTHLRVRSGQVDVAITNMMNGTIIGDFSLPGATLGGNPFSVEQSIPPGTPSSPSTVSTTRALDGYAFDLRGPTLDGVNSLATHLSYSNSADGPAITITDQDSILAVVSYHGIVPEYATGSFGTRSITVAPDSTSLDLFDNISGSLDLDEVTALLKIHNGVGVDARADIHYLRSENPSTGNVVELQHAITQGPVNLDRALDLGNGFQPALNTFLLNRYNSNIDLFVENLPHQVNYAMDLTINPLGDISNGHDFLYHDSRISADLELDIPLRLSATDLTLRKTVELDLPGSPEHHAWKSGVLHLFADNSFPFSAAVELAVLDENGAVGSVLAAQGSIAAGITGPDGLVAQSTQSRMDFTVSEDQMNLLQRSGKVLITAVFNTTDQGQHVQLRSTYALGLQLTADAVHTVNGDE
jgi:hypothetical protein